MISNALFRLFETKLDISFEGILDVLYDHLIEDISSSSKPKITEAEVVYYVILVKMSDDFKERLRQVYESDDQ